MVFVGGKVSQSVGKEEGSDITNVLKFFQKFIPLDPQKPKTEIGLGVIFGVVEISLFCG